MSHHHCLTSPPSSLPCHHHHHQHHHHHHQHHHHYCVNSPNNAFGHHLGLWYFLFSFHFVFLFTNMLPQAHSTSIITSTIPIAQTMQKHCLSYLVSFFFFFSFFFSFADTLLLSGAINNNPPPPHVTLWRHTPITTPTPTMVHHTYVPPHIPPPITSIFQHVHGLNDMSDVLFSPIVCFFLFFVLCFCYY